MKRRDFLTRSAGAALLASAPVAIAAGWRGRLLDDPQAWIGRGFHTPDGLELELVAVEMLPDDGRTRQARLLFELRGGELPRDGVHRLQCGLEQEELFLQRGRRGPVACINRLVGKA